MEFPQKVKILRKFRCNNFIVNFIETSALYKNLSMKLAINGNIN